MELSARCEETMGPPEESLPAVSGLRGPGAGWDVRPKVRWGQYFGMRMEKTPSACFRVLLCKYESKIDRFKG